MSLPPQILSAANKVATPLMKLRTGNLSPVFVLGHDRCGSTWVGDTLARAKNTIYLHEPINPHACGLGDWAGYNLYLRKGEENGIYQRVYDRVVRTLGVRSLRGRELVNRLAGHPTVVVKEVGAMMCGEWFQERYGAKIVVVSRHPVPTILSNLRMGAHNAENWLEVLLGQERLVEDQLGDVMEFISENRDADDFTKFAIVYCIRYRTLYAQLERNPGWLHVTYEDFCSDPVARFGDLLGFIGEDFSGEHEAAIREMCETDGSDQFFGTNRVSSVKVSDWKKKAGAGDVANTRRVCEAFRMPFYTDGADWEL